jgi:hypothetical protein
MSNGPRLENQLQLRAKKLTTEPAAPSVGRLPQITRVLALAIHFDDMLRNGDAKDYADIGRLTCLCRERVSQIMRLNYIAPDIQIELLYLPPRALGATRLARPCARSRIFYPGKSGAVGGCC